MPTAIRPPNSEVGFTHDSQRSPAPSSGTRPDAMPPATVPRKNGVRMLEVAKTTPKSRAWPRVSEYFRKAKLAPRSTMPSSASSSGSTSVDIAAAKDSGKPVHQVTST
ncbi:hypothetical protein L615_003900000100 [Nocardioides sp. J9]|nr:hypothetical protein L615_003900000100 [Nocardioides sp. J9]